jgi:hypothetical protein
LLRAIRRPSRTRRPASAPRGLGTAEWGRAEARWNLANAFPSVFFLDTPVLHCIK